MKTLEFKKLGRSDEKIPVLGLGTWGIGGFSSKNVAGDDDDIQALTFGLDLGMQLVDTAEMYASGHSEEVVARAIENRRESVFLATKVSPEHFSSEGVLKACDRSLKRLRTEYVDLYQAHWPNPRIPISETMKAMERLVREGKVRFIGVSNFSVEQTQEAREALSTVDVVSNQVEYSLLDRAIESELLPYAEQEQITIIAYSPLARGRIAKGSSRESQWSTIDKIATKYEKTRNQIALNWLITKQQVIAIPKSANLPHLKENLGGQGWKMQNEDYDLLNQTFR
ncbi:MAG TPA: aldo/keto reductase [Methylomirabilota bacterium]|nr:aldo/keto reductase [Methylomirabilota bacterium]